MMCTNQRGIHKALLCCRELGANGIKSLLAVPVSFVSEHIETLEEIDMEYRELAHESGIQNWGRVPALNTNPVFIDDLAEAVLEALPYVGLMAGSNPSDAMVPLGINLLKDSWDDQAYVGSTQWTGLFSDRKCNTQKRRAYHHRSQTVLECSQNRLKRLKVLMVLHYIGLSSQYLWASGFVVVK